MEHQEKIGVESLYITLHVNYPRDEILPRARIEWPKKPRIPYIEDKTENELVEETLELLQGDCPKPPRIMVKEAPRDTALRAGSHRAAQEQAYMWALQSARREYPDGAWMIVHDVDEFLLPSREGDTVHDCLERAFGAGRGVGSVICDCIVHPSRYDTGRLNWDRYVPHPGLHHELRKTVNDIHRVDRLGIHEADLKRPFTRHVTPDIHVHHFMGFNWYPYNRQGWPTPAHREYAQRQEGEYYRFRKASPSGARDLWDDRAYLDRIR